jgi:lipopolysaccharide transport system permease protein
LEPTITEDEFDIVIRPSSGWLNLQMNELWRYRELLYFLTWRDIKVRYKQTVLGMAWAVLQPLMSMVVFTIFFGRLARIAPDGDLPYEIWNYAALVPWMFFANGLSKTGNSLVGSANLITKVYFPRMVIPIATVLSGVVDFVLAFVILILMMLAYQIVPTANIIWLPLFLLLAFVTALGMGMWLSAMNVMFRDVRYILPFMTQLWLFITPIAYPSSLIQDDVLRTLYGVNPMVGVVEGFRWALLGIDTVPSATILVSCGVAILLLVTGAYYFRRMEKSFADVV